VPLGAPMPNGEFCTMSRPSSLSVGVANVARYVTQDARGAKCAKLARHILSGKAT